MILPRFKYYNYTLDFVKCCSVRCSSTGGRKMIGPQAALRRGTVGDAYGWKNPSALVGAGTHRRHRSKFMCKSGSRSLSIRDQCFSSNAMQTRHVWTLHSMHRSMCYQPNYSLSWNLQDTNTLKAHLSTTLQHGGSEEDRVSRAYLGEDLSRTVQKHDGNRLVYEVRGQVLLRFVTLSFYATAAVGLYLAPDLLSSAWENEVLNREAVTNLVAIACAVVGLPACLRLMSKRLVLKLYHNEARETYVAVTQSLLLMNKTTTFSLEDVVVKEHRSVLSRMFNLTSFKAGRHPFHVNPYNFKLPSDYNHLLGYDRVI